VPAGARDEVSRAEGRAPGWEQLLLPPPPVTGTSPLSLTGHSPGGAGTGVGQPLDTATCLKDRPERSDSAAAFQTLLVYAQEAVRKPSQKGATMPAVNCVAVILYLGQLLLVALLSRPALTVYFQLLCIKCSARSVTKTCTTSLYRHCIECHFKENCHPSYYYEM
jgi:hypothetical protein